MMVRTHPLQLLGISLFFLFYMVQAAKLMGAGSALIALAGVGAGIGIVFGSLIQSAGRNPLMAKQLMGYALLGFALCESIALFTLLVAFLILFSSNRKGFQKETCVFI
jgi:F-type H+-transporting ATPase subunit c